MKRKYILEEAKKTGRSPEIGVFAYNTKEDFERASVGLVELKGRHDRTKQPISDRVYLILEGEGEFLFGNWEKDEIVPVSKDDVVSILENTACDYWRRMRRSLVHAPAHEQDSDGRLDDLWD